MTISRNELVNKLTLIKDNSYKLSSVENIMDYVESMINNIGDINPDFRDGLIYETFCNWICDNDYFNKDQLLCILNKAMDNDHLFYKIGSDEEDAVFTRTFSALLIDLLLDKNTSDEFMDDITFSKVKNNVINYYKSEKDFRGFVKGKGWAHGAAHGADMLHTIVNSNKYNESIGIEVLDAIKVVLQNGKYFLSNEEDERITLVVSSIIINNLVYKDKIFNWLDSLADITNIDVNTFIEENRWIYIDRVNAKMFVRSLYFSIMRHQGINEMTEKLFKVEEKLNRFVKVNIWFLIPSNIK